jgi:hypothetical protein
MTTVVYSNGVMACDSAWGSVYSGTKIQRLNSGALLGSAGDPDSRVINKMFDEVITPKDFPSYEDLFALEITYTGLLVLPDGSVWLINTSADHKPNTALDSVGIFPAFQISSIGSGGDIALGAVLAGADVEEAVRIACERDISSRPPVHVVPLKE